MITEEIFHYGRFCATRDANSMFNPYLIVKTRINKDAYKTLCKGMWNSEISDSRLGRNSNNDI